MDEERAAERLRALDDGRWVSTNRVRVLARLSEIYEKHGVLAHGSACSLHRHCPAAESCWAGISVADRPATTALGDARYDEPGSIFWPWIGELYGPGGLCLIGININADDDDWWSINVEYAITKVVYESLGSGHRKVIAWNSPFAYRSTASAAAILASLDGQDPIAAPEPPTLISTLERIARVQAVKCSPTRDRGRPTDAMWHNCPPRYLREELAVLSPHVLLLFGGEARWVVEQLGDVRYRVTGPEYWRGTLRVDDLNAEVFALPHPSAWAGRWARGQALMVDDLRISPAHQA